MRCSFLNILFFLRSVTILSSYSSKKGSKDASGHGKLLEDLAKKVDTELGPIKVGAINCQRYPDPCLDFGVKKRYPFVGLYVIAYEYLFMLFFIFVSSYSLFFMMFVC